MTSDNTRTATVVVAVDADTAFRVFTEEMTDWWVPGPINFYDSTLALGMRCEPGVGGRVIEVYDERTGEGLELGRIQEWKPGSHLRWQSSLDDVKITVKFEPIDVGTRVVVEAVVPQGGRDAGGSSWVRVAPTWFATWCSRRLQENQSRPALSRLGLTLFYEKPGPAARWLQQVVGLQPTLPLPEDEAAERAWIEFRVGGGLLIVLKRESEEGSDSTARVPWIFVDDLEGHYRATESAGATIIEGINQHGYRAYTIEDPEGHQWTIAQALPSMVKDPVSFSV